MTGSKSQRKRIETQRPGAEFADDSNKVTRPCADCKHTSHPGGRCNTFVTRGTPAMVRCPCSKKGDAR